MNTYEKNYCLNLFQVFKKIVHQKAKDDKSCRSSQKLLSETAKKLGCGSDKELKTHVLMKPSEKRAQGVFDYVYENYMFVSEHFELLSAKQLLYKLKPDVIPYFDPDMIDLYDEPVEDNMVEDSILGIFGKSYRYSDIKKILDVNNSKELLFFQLCFSKLSYKEEYLIDLYDLLKKYTTPTSKKVMVERVNETVQNFPQKVVKGSKVHIVDVYFYEEHLRFMSEDELDKADNARLDYFEKLESSY